MKVKNSGGLLFVLFASLFFMNVNSVYGNISKKICSLHNSLDDLNVISPNAKSCAIVYRNEAGKMYIIDRGKRSGYYNDIRNIMFSGDSKHLVYVASRNCKSQIVNIMSGNPESVYGKWFVVLDGQEGEKYDYVDDLRFTPDNNLVYIGYKFCSYGGYKAGCQGSNSKAFIVYNGREQNYFDEIGEFTISPDGKHLAYAAVKGGENFIIIDGKITTIDGTAYDLKYSPNSAMFGYSLKEGYDPDKMAMVVNGIKSKQYDSVYELTFSPNSKHFAYQAITTDGNNSVLVLDGKEYKKYKRFVSNRFDIDKITFSNDSQHVAYRYHGIVFLDGRKLGWGNILAFSPDNKLAYTRLQNNREYLIFKGQMSKGYPVQLAIFPAIKDIYFSRDNKRFAYTVDHGSDKMFIVLDQKESSKYYLIDQAAFSPNSKHSAYIVTSSWGDKSSNAFVVLDGKKRKVYDSIDKMYFTKDSKFIVYAASKDDNQYLITEPVCLTPSS